MKKYMAGLGVSVGALALIAATSGFPSEPSRTSLKLADATATKGPPPDAFGHYWPNPPAQPVPVSTDPSICGAWSSLDSKNMQNLESVHGSFDGCFKVGGTWVLVMQHTASPGEIGLEVCGADANCLDGTQDRDFSKFHWLTAPAGGLTLNVLGQTGPLLDLADGRSDFSFDITNKVFSR